MLIYAVHKVLCYLELASLLYLLWNVPSEVLLYGTA